ncbi:MAG: OmpA family protein [Saprospiraceae bacterium]|nr:OmpA family protein [Saprospiraceae bacterium]
MNSKHLFLGLIVAILAMPACVSKKKFTALEEEKANLSTSLANLEKKVDMIEADKNTLAAEKEELTKKVGMVESQLMQTEEKVAAVNKSVEDKQSQINVLRDEITNAFSDVEKAVSESGQRITELEDMLYLDLENPINFATGSSRLNKEDDETLQTLADMLKKSPNLNLIIEGHTDDRPINTARYQDNWDLSVARSVAIVRKLIDMGVNPKQLTAAGKGEYHPTVTDDPTSNETRAANRRSEVIIVPQIGKLYQMHKEKGS